MMSAAPKPEKEEIKVFISHRSSTCGECLEDLGSESMDYSGQRQRRAVPIVCGFGSAYLSCLWRCGTDPTRAQAFPFVRRGFEMEPGPQAIRAPRDPGRRAGA